MENTVITTTISIDTDQLRREITAESACIALMTAESAAPAMLTDDQRALITVHIDNALIEFQAEFAAFIDASGYDSPGNAPIEIPLRIPADAKAPAQAFRRLIEKIIADRVLATCYETQPALAASINERNEGNRSRLRTLLAPGRMKMRNPLF